jgi:hypothetical protein
MFRSYDHLQVEVYTLEIDMIMGFNLIVQTMSR